MSLTRLISWARRALSRPGRAKSFGRTPLRVGFSRSMAVHGVVDRAADRRLGSLGLQVRPAGLARDPEDAGGLVLVGVLGVGALLLAGGARQLGVLGLKRVADVLEEDQPEHDVLVLGRVHVVAEGVGRLPELGFEAIGGAGGAGGGGVSAGRGAAGSGSAWAQVPPLTTGRPCLRSHGSLPMARRATCQLQPTACTPELIARIAAASVGRPSSIASCRRVAIASASFAP